MSDIESTLIRLSISTINECKKRKNNLGVIPSDNDSLLERSNWSHTSYFFRKDPNNNNIAYCIICERISKKLYPYSQKVNQLQIYPVIYEISIK